MLTIPDSLITRLAEAKTVTVLTGAGISAESGVPTFRDAQSGLWARYDPHQLATAEGFASNPKLVWEWYEWRRQIISKVRPNPGHVALAEMERLFPKYSLITQNVDALHERSGSKDVIELHGNIHRNKCFVEGIVIDSWPSDDSVPPRCPRCSGWLRPDVVWFGESLPLAALAHAELSAMTCEVFLSVGTSSQVHPAAGLADAAKAAGAVIVEINLEKTPLTKTADYSLRGKAGELLPALVTAIGSQSAERKTGSE
ncbi:MAG TPA: NAD-dependent deacylase [Burkholderiales bacterium]|nr:NAD-dependent deacylase [Burkholderiales bacterium]